MAWVEAKRIKNKTYLYLRYRDGNRNRSRYLGKAGADWVPGMTAPVEWQPGQPLPDITELKPPKDAPTTPPAELAGVSKNGWPACVCCGRPAQTLDSVTGEPICYRCLHSLSNCTITKRDTR